mmetsp:Transcript_22383/g.37937  ORF Transcript_22383/g.37937 Transcript_22383/m.37937 type:complete len:181 (+) Transcript_22383:47-589(+)
MSKNESLDPEAGWKKLRTYWVGKWWYDPNMPRLPPWTKDDVDQFVKEYPTEGRQLKKLRFRFKLRMYSAFAGFGAGVAYGVSKSKNPLVWAVGGMIGGLALPSATTLAHRATCNYRMDFIDPYHVNDTFLSWHRTQKHIEFYKAKGIHPPTGLVANPDIAKTPAVEPGAAPSASTAAGSK